MKKNVFILGIAALALSSCNQFKKGEGDLLYKIHEDKNGPTIKDGDMIAFKAIEKTEEDSVIFSSYDFDRSAILVKEKSLFKGDINAALSLLSEGDSATFKVNLDSMQAKMGQPKPQNTKGKYMIFQIKVEKVIPRGKLNDQAFRAEIEKFMTAESTKAKSQEASKINGYINSNNLKPSVTSTGLNYVITQQSNGAKATAGDTVQVNYTGKFLSGKVFDTSIQEVAKKAGNFNPMRPYTPIKIPVGVGESIKGFEEGLMLLPKGSKATLILPSSLAYGEQGNPAIPPFTPLVFDVEVLNIIPKSANAATPPPPAPVPPAQK